jgi:hypothetical protein
MRPRIVTAVVGALIAVSVLGSSSVLAQDRARDQTRDPAADQERIQDRGQDRIADRDRLQDRDQDRDLAGDRDRDQDRDRDRTQDRDRLYIQDRDQLRNRDIYGSELMTRQERREYRNRIEAMNTVQEWARFRARHQTEMQVRAREQGADLERPYYGQQLMTDREREQLRERLRDATSEQQRERIRTESRQQMQERAREYEIPLSELE